MNTPQFRYMGCFGSGSGGSGFLHKLEKHSWWYACLLFLNSLFSGWVEHGIQQSVCGDVCEGWSVIVHDVHVILVRLSSRLRYGWDNTAAGEEGPSQSLLVWCLTHTHTHTHTKTLSQVSSGKRAFISGSCDDALPHYSTFSDWRVAAWMALSASCYLPWLRNYLHSFLHSFVIT